MSLRTEATNKVSFSGDSSSSESGGLKDLIAKKLWHVLLTRIISESCDSIENIMDLDGDGNNLLHLVCRNNPTVEVVEEILQDFPELSKKPNRDGQYPIHYAAQWGSSPSVIRLLCEKHNLALEYPDCHGQTPLILACKYYSKNYSYKRTLQDDSFLRNGHAASQAIKMIARARPSAANIEDSTGCTAIEYALDSDIDLDTIQCVQRASYRDWKLASRRKLESSLRITTVSTDGSSR